MELAKYLSSGKNQEHTFVIITDELGSYTWYILHEIEMHEFKIYNNNCVSCVLPNGLTISEN